MQDLFLLGMVKNMTYMKIRKQDDVPSYGDMGEMSRLEHIEKYYKTLG